MPWRMRDLTPNELGLIADVVKDEQARAKKQQAEAARARRRGR